MREVSNYELKELKESGQLEAGMVYRVIDYEGSTELYVVADSEKELADESYTEDPQIVESPIRMHYDLENNKVDYMKDIDRRIEGYFDWTNNVQGDCSDICFENAYGLIVKESYNVVCENTVTRDSYVTKSHDITIGDGSFVQIENCSNVIVGGSTVNISSSSDVTVGERNNITLSGKTAVAVADDNENITFDNFNKIGSRNKNITIEGESNVIRSDNNNLNIEGDLNDVVESRFVELNGSFNDVEKTSLTGLTNAVGNSVVNSSSIDIVNTNNNSVAVRDIIIQNKPAFIEYVSQHNSDTKIVRNLVENVNMVSDCQARTLIIDEDRFYQEKGSSGTKGNTKYVLVDGVWTAVNY